MKEVFFFVGNGIVHSGFSLYLRKMPFFYPNINTGQLIDTQIQGICGYSNSFSNKHNFIFSNCLIVFSRHIYISF